MTDSPPVYAEEKEFPDRSPASCAECPVYVDSEEQQNRPPNDAGKAREVKNQQGTEGHGESSIASMANECVGALTQALSAGALTQALSALTQALSALT